MTTKNQIDRDAVASTLKEVGTQMEFDLKQLFSQESADSYGKPGPGLARLSGSRNTRNERRPE